MSFPTVSCSSGLGLWQTFDSCIREDVTGSVVEGENENEENENEARENRECGPWRFSGLLVNKCVAHKSSFLPGQKP